MPACPLKGCCCGGATVSRVRQSEVKVTSHNRVTQNRALRYSVSRFALCVLRAIVENRDCGLCIALRAHDIDAQSNCSIFIINSVMVTLSPLGSSLQMSLVIYSSGS